MQKPKQEPDLQWLRLHAVSHLRHHIAKRVLDARQSDRKPDFVMIDSESIQAAVVSLDSVFKFEQDAGISLDAVSSFLSQVIADPENKLQRVHGRGQAALVYSLVSSGLHVFNFEEGAPNGERLRWAVSRGRKQIKGWQERGVTIMNAPESTVAIDEAGEHSLRYL